MTAHRQGIVHRDLKPDNILVSKSRVKLLDFGLAKPCGDSDATVTNPITGAQVVLGTPQYMAPEQVEGKPADARTDIFALGCVLYELLAGRRAFEGKSPASVIAARYWLSSRRASGKPNPTISAALERVVTICLSKDPDDRWQSARDLKYALRGVRESTTARPAGRPYAKAGWIAAGLLLIVAAALGDLAFRRTPEKGRPVRFSIKAPDNTTLAGPEGIARRRTYRFLRPSNRRLSARGKISDLCAKAQLFGNDAHPGDRGRHGHVLVAR